MVRALTNGATLYYSAAARALGLDALVRAESFIRLIKNHAAMPGRQPNEGVPKLVDVRKAAEILGGISERTLATLTKSGSVPCVRIGHLVKYSVDTLWEIIKRGGCQ